MSKPPAKRRKTSSNADGANSHGSGRNPLLAHLDLADKSATPKSVAKALLSLLPGNATKQHASAKLLAKAFPLVMAELDARANKLARQNQTVGARQPIQFRFVGKDDDEDAPLLTTINLPEECFVNVMQFLDGREIVGMSRVSKVWLSASRLPIVWEDGLDMSRTNLNKKLNMTSLLKLLGRPQFANLKGLALPIQVKLGKNSIKQLAKLFPHLETFDVGYYCENAKAKDSDLIAVTEQFSNLTSLRTDMWNVTSSGITLAVQALGEQLIDLRIKGDTITKHYLSRMALDTISSFCPNLKYFAYRFNTSLFYDPNRDGVRGDDIVRLVERCPRLETLELHNARHVKKEHFVAITNRVANDLNAFALRKIIAHGYDDGKNFGFEEYPLLVPFSVRNLLAAHTFLQVEDRYQHPVLDRGVTFLGVNDTRMQRYRLGRTEDGM